MGLFSGPDGNGGFEHEEQIHEQWAKRTIDREAGVVLYMMKVGKVVLIL